MNVGRVVVLLICVLLSESARAGAQNPQAPQVGVFSKIRGLHAAPPCPAARAVVRPEPAVRIVRGNSVIGATASQVETRNVPVEILDSIEVPRSSDARLLVRSPLGRGLFVLTPDFGRCFIRSERDTFPGGGPDNSTHASYKIDTIRDSASRQKALELVVNLGAVTVEWSKGLLYVYALTKHIRVTGTEFAVRVDSSSSTAFVYVKNGSVRFEESPNVVVSAGELYWWSAGGAPQRVTDPPSGLLDDYYFHARELWRSTHLVRNIAAVGSAAALILVVRNNCCDGGSRRRSGTVIVGLPL